MPKRQRKHVSIGTPKKNCTKSVSCQNKFVKLVHLVGSIIKKFVTMHGHTSVKFVNAKKAKETCQYRDTKEKLY